MNILAPSDLHFLGSLPPDVRAETERWRDLLTSVTKPIRQSLERAAAVMGVSYKTARRKYDLFRKSGYSISSLVNRAKVPPTGGALTPEFLDWFKALAENNQRKTKPAYRRFCSMWNSGAQIPGMDNSLPRHCLPAGFSYDNINNRITDLFALTAMRQGLGAAIAKCGPQIFTTRSKLWCMSHLMIDDLWHDNFVVFQRQLVRVLELDALDVFSGYLPTFGCKPRTQRADGSFENLREKYARILVANVFFNFGYSPRGTLLLAEHGTAAVSETCARILHDRSGGLIKLRESGITGEEQAIIGWNGRGKGNPRFKAALESIRNLKHNEQADRLLVPGQTGKDVESRPEYLHGQLKECEDLLKCMAFLAKRNPARAVQIKLNLLDYHAHFLPLLMDIYAAINRRGEFPWWSHDLEGWHDAGNIAIEYRTTPSSDHWLTDAEFSQLPEISRTLLLEAAKADSSYINHRKLSPREVFQRDRAGLLKLPAFAVAELLGEDFGRELKVHGAYFNEFQDADVAPEALRFESVIATPDGQRQQLADGTYYTAINPFDPSILFVMDSRKVLLGVAPRVQRIDRADDEALKGAFGHRSQRLAELKAPILSRHASEVRAETNRLAHNASVISSVDAEQQAELEDTFELLRKSANDF